MSQLVDGVRTINSSLRTLIFLSLAGGVGYGGYVGYENYVKPGIEAKNAVAKMEEMETKLQESESKLQESETKLHQTSVELAESIVENDKLATSMKLLKVDRRLANIEVLKTGKNSSGEDTMTVLFTELDEGGQVIGSPREFELRGRLFYIDCWLVKFEDKYIEEAAPLRSASLHVFKSIYGDLDGPSGSFPLDLQTSGIPDIYRDDRKSAFEEQIWNDFWNLSNNPDLQHDLGIRASHGEAVYILGEPGQTYQIDIRASGATSLKPITKRSDTL